VLSLKQPAPQIEACMRPTRERAQRRTVCGFEVCQLLQPLED
jgi:hypothetical protein